MTGSPNLVYATIESFAFAGTGTAPGERAESSTVVECNGYAWIASVSSFFLTPLAPEF